MEGGLARCISCRITRFSRATDWDSASSPKHSEGETTNMLHSHLESRFLCSLTPLFTILTCITFLSLSGTLL